MRSISSRWKRWILGAVVILGVAGAGLVYDRLFRARPARYFESDQDHFLHGSVGAESTEGIPYWIWLVLPRIVPDLLPGPGGYASLGMLSRQGHDLPIGLSKATIGYPRVAVNCAFCHTAAVRYQPDEVPTLIPGAPAHQTAMQGYRRFLVAAASDARFNAGTILGEIARNYRLSAVDRILYRFVVIPDTRRRLLRLREEIGVMDEPDWGPGRADVFGAIKFHRLGLPPDRASGGVDVMPLWSSAQRGPRGFFWDGLHASLQDAVVTSALSAGASRPWLDADIEKWDRTGAREQSSLRRIQNYIGTLEPPRYPFPVDRALAASGEAVYRSECARCHAPEASRTSEIASAGGAAGISISGAGTDSARRGVWTADAIAAYDAFAGGRAWRSSGFQNADDYVAVPLDGAWLRAPYLHNGSVPSLRDLLQAAQNRPSRFWRGFDTYDAVNVGFVSSGTEAERKGTLYDTAHPGNSNAGHAYGTTLPEQAKRALLEYLKTL
jgi:mono/diheme cytochrome c family protein